jgi:DNA-binding Xre family transcriptional regulator
MGAKSFLQSEIERRMKVLGWSGRKLSAKSGINETGIKAILSGKSKHPRSDTLENIARALGCTVADLTGEHDRMPGLHRAKGPTSTRLLVIDELNVRAGAADGGQVHGEASMRWQHESVEAQWSIPAAVVRGQTSAPANELKIIRVVGDSMEPEFLPGERIMVDTGDRLPSPPGIFAIWDGFAQIIKRLEMVPYSEPPMVRLMSANKEYAARELRLDEMVINGRVVGKWKWT